MHEQSNAENPQPTPRIRYAAKSDQDDKDSNESQLKRIDAQLEREPGFNYGEPFAEDKRSAFRGNRGEQLQAAIDTAVKAAEEHGQAELWVFHSSRLARGSGKKDEARSLLKLYADMRAQGVRLRSVDDDEYLNNPVLIGIASEQNWKFASDLSGHVCRGLRETFERGELGGGPVPDGYDVLREIDGKKVKRTYRRDPERAPVIEAMYELHEQGSGPANIARELNGRGLRTEKGKPWTRRSVQDKLTNPRYAGAVVWHQGQPDEEVNWAGQHPALIEPERWRRLQAARVARDKARGSNRSPRGRHHRNHALARLARCQRCGEVMYPVTGNYRRKSDGGRRRTYMCSNMRASTGLCDQPSIDAELTDRHVIAELERYLGDFERWRDSLVTGYESERERLARELAEAQEELAEHAQRIAKLEARAGRYLDADDEDKADAAFAMLARQRSERELIEKRLSATESALESVPDEAPTDDMLDFYAALQDAIRGRLEGAQTMARVNEALRDLFERFDLDALPDGGVTVAPVLLGGRFDFPQTCWSVATGEEPITPPLRVLEATPEGNGRNSQEYLWRKLPAF